MLRLEVPPVSAIPAHLVDLSTEVACPWCRAVCTAIRDESGRAARAVDVLWWEPPASGADHDASGRFRGWVWAVVHLCRPMLMAFQGSKGGG